MCMFCASIPMVSSIGSVAIAKQKRWKRLSQSTPVRLSVGQRWWLSVPTVTLTTALVLLLLLSSAYYHSRIQPV